MAPSTSTPPTRRLTDGVAVRVAPLDFQHSRVVTSCTRDYSIYTQAPDSEYEQLCMEILVEQIRQAPGQLEAVAFLSAPARRAFGMAEGQVDYDKFMPIFQGGGLGATRVLIDEPRSTLFLAFDHPASARFRQEFWGWVREARDYVRSRLG